MLKLSNNYKNVELKDKTYLLNQYILRLENNHQIQLSTVCKIHTHKS